MTIIHLVEALEMQWHDKGIIIPNNKDLRYMREIARLSRNHLKKRYARDRKDS